MFGPKAFHTENHILTTNLKCHLSNNPMKEHLSKKNKMDLVNLKMLKKQSQITKLYNTLIINQLLNTTWIIKKLNIKLNIYLKFLTKLLQKM